MTGKNKFSMFLAAFLTLLNCSTGFFAQVVRQIETLGVDREIAFTLKNNEEKMFRLDLKKDDFAEIYYTDSLNRGADVSLLAPSGTDVFRDIYTSDSTPFVAPETGKYTLRLKFDATENSNEEAKISVGYTNVFKMLKSARLARQRKINGYDVKVYNASTEDELATYLLIEKNGKLKQILKGGSMVAGGFNFADDAKLFDFAEGKKSAALMRTTVDKTGDGTPDVAIQFYTGGAHCCIDVHFYELGANEARKVKTVAGADSDVLAVGKKTNGSLILKTGDSNFAYWLTSFAGSPIPTVILSYKNGEFRPDSELMKKPAPTVAILKRKADKAKSKMTLSAYGNEENDGFIYEFWGEMIDLMYAGNESAAWRYLDMVWDMRKPGKEKFRRDFLEQLNKSPYWRMLKEERQKGMQK